MNQRLSNLRDLSIEGYNYDLPTQSIATYPLENRDASKLLIYKNGKISESKYKNLYQEIPEDYCLVFNNTKVVEARLFFQKPSGGKIEIFCLEPHEKYGDITSAMLQKESVQWKCLVGGASKWKENLIISANGTSVNGELKLEAKRIERRADCFIIELSWNLPELSFAEVLHYMGEIPIPPYLNRKTEQTDLERYQTIYAKQDGSVAAPTAGLHFTKEVLQSLASKNIQSQFVTLHVGAGTFKPVKSDTINGHEMHSEFIDVELSTIKELCNNSGKIIAVGTTSLRTIETLYWMGVKAYLKPDSNLEELEIKQWDVYEKLHLTNISPSTALEGLMNWLKSNQINKLITKTQIMIAPGYQLKMAEALITNFHQPQSTLLLLVSALIGENWKSVYRYALENGFRFLSYGDGSILWKENKL